MTHKSKFGLYNFLGVWTNRIFWSAILVLALLNFDQNPNGLTILIAIVLFVVLRIKTDQLIVTDRTIEIRRRIIYDTLPIVTIIPKDALKDIQITGNRNLGNNLIQNILPIGLKFKNRLTFKLSDGKVKSFQTDIFTDELELFKEFCKKNA